MTTGSPDAVIEIGRIGRSHGIHGGFRVWLHNAASDLLDRSTTLWVQGPDEVPVVWAVRSVRAGPRGSRVVSVAEITSRDAAEAHTGWTVLVPKAALPEPGPTEFYYHEVPGFDVVTASGQPIGRVAYALETGVDNLIVIRPSGEELMVPVAGDMVLEIDRAGRRIVVPDDIEQRFE